jgi:hypothetical protein
MVVDGVGEALDTKVGWSWSDMINSKRDGVNWILRLRLLLVLLFIGICTVRQLLVIIATRGLLRLLRFLTNFIRRARNLARLGFLLLCHFLCCPNHWTKELFLVLFETIAVGAYLIATVDITTMTPILCHLMKYIWTLTPLNSYVCVNYVVVKLAQLVFHCICRPVCDVGSVKSLVKTAHRLQRQLLHHLRPKIARYAPSVLAQHCLMERIVSSLSGFLPRSCQQILIHSLDASTLQSNEE